tara:strand:- start:4998 stop:5216 length:219 start_codon:yes stop_codon:yes gene_type:complete
MSEESKKSIPDYNTKGFRKELKESGWKPQEKKVKKSKKEYSKYGVPMSETCHMGYECGISGLTCNASSCPHT